jgi:transcriptional regulator with XRE-family HTH domain
MEAKNLTVYSLEKKAGLNRSAVRNILQGFSKKPSADVLMSIAEALDCTVNDLIDSRSDSSIVSNKIKTVIKTRNSHPWNDKLYIEAIKIVSKCINDKDTIKSEQVISLINETYKYSLDKGADSIDQDFTKWLVNKSV